ncbi:unnamed protein product [Gemmata massiliana]|uniref:Uncharacterized protein n=1 Tax=Gemmata massiliana TaxID=1210884 RepID=A0A6P2CZN7_9BACT|nr:hypothetical protein [Gemmata massiliana]VTR94027.1 unnamed protein product [Gemmata massiliana]
MSQQTSPEPIDAAALALLSEGAMKVREAREFSGLSRQQLFALMGDGTLPWFPLNERGDRASPRSR